MVKSAILKAAESFSRGIGQLGGVECLCSTNLEKENLHKKLRGDLQLPNDCVIHSLRHTFLTRFGEAGADAFTIKKVAGHSSVTISER